MADYQVVARKYRPQTFAEVLGQNAIVATLKNAIKQSRLAHAYLFCGSRGTGKTTLARIFAKVINCMDPTAEHEPCNACRSCKEITSGSSLDVLEIDGASHRGIEDIRQINETIGYSASSGRYKVYIIDEVHMLTKEAFNALLKTLEEPPAHAKFLFATTEAHKVLPTILSRCQRFNLRRISDELIQQKLRHEAQDLGVEIEDDALRLIAASADGGMRDAESILDQMIAFSDGKVSHQGVSEALGYASRDQYFSLDDAIQKQDYSAAFTIAHQVFAEGKDIPHFVEGLLEHYRTLLRLHLAKDDQHQIHLQEHDLKRYLEIASRTEVALCLGVLDYLVEAQKEIRFAASQRMSLEVILLKLIRLHHQIPIERLVQRLHDLEKQMSSGEAPQPATQPVPQPTAVAAPQPAPEPKPAPAPTSAPAPKVEAKPEPKPEPPTQKPQPAPKPQPVAAPPVQKAPAPPPPTPTASPAEMGSMIERQSRYDTLFQFATVELGGKLRKAPIKRR